MKEKNKKKNFLTALILFFMLFVSTSSIYAYWSEEVLEPGKMKKDLILEIGRAKNIETELSITSVLQSEDKKLVPKGMLEKSQGGSKENVETFEVIYTVFWKEDEQIIADKDKIQAKLEVTGELTKNPNGLGQMFIDPVRVDISPNGPGVPVKLQVSLQKPKDDEEYATTLGEEMLAKIRFSVEY